MLKSQFSQIRITGVAGAVPRGRIDNSTDHPQIDASEKRKTIKLTGVREYRKAGPDVCASDLCRKAAEALLEEMEVEPGSLDAVLFVSQTPDYRMPSTACVLQDRLGCDIDTLAFDINLGCSGFVYGLYTAAAFLRGAGLNRVLLLCGDTQTKLCHDTDKNVCFILGDGGTACLVESSPDTVSQVTVGLHTDGSGFSHLITPAGGFRHPSTGHTQAVERQPDGGLRSQEHLFMDGMEIFNFSVTQVVQTLRTFMQEEGLEESQLDLLFLHQANKFMTDKIARKLKIPSHKVPYTLDRYGNTSSASIPLTIADHFSTQSPVGPVRCLLAGFGVGLSWGVVDIVLDDIVCPPICEV